MIYKPVHMIYKSAHTIYKPAHEIDITSAIHYGSARRIADDIRDAQRVTTPTILRSSILC